MNRDFFLLLLGVAVVELAIRYASLRLDFARSEPMRLARAAQQRANDVKSIMLNSGGPLAAQTVQPRWTDGVYEKAATSLTAEQFCPNCHVKLALTLAALDAGAAMPAGTVLALRAQLQQLQFSFDRVSDALRNVVPPVVVTQAQSAEYQAFMTSLRQIALLEATMQKVAESGQQVLQRLAQRGEGHRAPA